MVSNQNSLGGDAAEKKKKKRKKKVKNPKTS